METPYATITVTDFSVTIKYYASLERIPRGRTIYLKSNLKIVDTEKGFNILGKPYCKSMTEPMKAVLIHSDYKIGYYKTKEELRDEYSNLEIPDELIGSKRLLFEGLYYYLKIKDSAIVYYKDIDNNKILIDTEGLHKIIIYDYSKKII